MTLGVGGSDAERELAELADMTGGIQAIGLQDYEQRVARAQALMREAGLDAVYLNAGTNLYYFTGTLWGASERLVGALLPAQGEVCYLAPAFELGFQKRIHDVQGQPFAHNTRA